MWSFFKSKKEKNQKRVSKGLITKGQIRKKSLSKKVDSNYLDQIDQFRKPSFNISKVKNEHSHARFNGDDQKIDIESHPRIKELKQLASTFGSKPTACPSCKNTPEKSPKRKTKCKACGEYIYPRKNAITGQSIFLVEKELEIHKEMEAYAKGYWDSYHREKLWIEEGKKRVARALKVDDWTKVPVGDAKWSNYNEERNEAFGSGNLHQYWVTTHLMLIQRKAEKPDQDFYLLKAECIFFLYNSIDHGVYGVGLTQEETLKQASQAMSVNMNWFWDKQDWGKLEQYYNTFFDHINGAGWNGHFRFSAAECWDFFMDDVKKNAQRFD